MDQQTAQTAFHALRKTGKHRRGLNAARELIAKIRCVRKLRHIAILETSTLEQNAAEQRECKSLEEGFTSTRIALVAVASLIPDEELAVAA